jgi:hypothetical protein
MTTCYTKREAGVVLRASVETNGPAGEVELTWNVKWPAAALAATSCDCEDVADAPPQEKAMMMQDGNQATLIARRPRPLQAKKPIDHLGAGALPTANGYGEETQPPRSGSESSPPKPQE